jgi:methylmalonyl-CoA mutase cobalamin-binding subunit
MSLPVVECFHVVTGLDFDVDVEVHKRSVDVGLGVSGLQASHDMLQADLADRDFAAERTQVIVVSSGNVSALDKRVNEMRDAWLVLSRGDGSLFVLYLGGLLVRGDGSLTRSRAVTQMLSVGDF